MIAIGGDVGEAPELLAGVREVDRVVQEGAAA